MATTIYIVAAIFLLKKKTFKRINTYICIIIFSKGI